MSVTARQDDGARTRPLIHSLIHVRCHSMYKTASAVPLSLGPHRHRPAHISSPLFRTRKITRYHFHFHETSSASASHHAALPGRRRRDERRLRRERRGRREWRRACFCVCFCVPLYVLRALRVRRHVLWCWFCPELLASPGHHQCVYL